MKLFTKEYCFVPKKERISQEIRRLMKEHNYTADGLMVAVNKHLEEKIDNPKAIYKWTSGESIPKVDNLIALAEVFGITLDELVLPDSTFESDYKLDNIEYQIEMNKIHVFIKNSIDEKEGLVFDKSGFPILDYNKFNKQVNLDKIIIFNKKREYLLQKRIRGFISRQEEDELYYSANPYKDISMYQIFKNYVDEVLGREGKNGQTREDSCFELICGYGDQWRYLSDYISYLYLFNNDDYYKKMIEILSPIDMDVVYNYLLLIDDSALSKFANMLYDLGARKSKHIIEVFNDQFKEVGTEKAEEKMSKDLEEKGLSSLHACNSRFFIKDKMKMVNIENFAAFVGFIYGCIYALPYKKYLSGRSE